MSLPDSDSNDQERWTVFNCICGASHVIFDQDDGFLCRCGRFINFIVGEIIGLDTDNTEDIRG